MPFSAEIREEILVRSARHCCVCHNPTGLNIEIHHISPRQQGGEDTLENAIALCFNCHADAGHYFVGHPKGSKLSPAELLQHKREWFRIVEENKIQAPKECAVELTVELDCFVGTFQPVFIKRMVRYLDRNQHKDTWRLLGKDPMDFVREFKEETKKNHIIAPYAQRINTYDDYLDFLNGDEKENGEKADDDCQPVVHRFGAFGTYRQLNKSNCVLKLKFANHGPEVLEDYKLYLQFENVVSADAVDKRTEFLDSFAYRYNVRFDGMSKGEFNPANKVLVQGDSVLLDAICFRPNYLSDGIRLHWKMFARNVRAEGTLFFALKVKFENRDEIKYVVNADVAKNFTAVIPKIVVD